LNYLMISNLSYASHIRALLSDRISFHDYY